MSILTNSKISSSNKSNIKLSNAHSLSFSQNEKDKEFMEIVEEDRMTTIKSLNTELDNDNFNSLKFITDDINNITNIFSELFDDPNSLIIIPVINQNDKSIQNVIEKKIILQVPFT